MQKIIKKATKLKTDKFQNLHLQQQFSSKSKILQDDIRQAEFSQSFQKMNLAKHVYSLDSSTVSTKFSGFSIHPNSDSDYLNIKKLIDQDQFVEEMNKDEKLSKCVASILGNAIADALGSHTEFSKFNEKRNDIEPSWKSLKEWALKNKEEQLVFGLFSDDFAMARCIADSFLSNDLKFNPIDLRFRFMLWWYTGYNNGSKNLSSFGLGGNIAEGFSNFFLQQCPPYVISDISQLGHVNGNGSVMRLSPIPVLYHDDIEKGKLISKLHSLTTHDGEEAAECCRLLTHIVTQLINYKGQNPKEIFENIGEQFQTDCIGVQYLAKSVNEPQINLKLHDRRYNQNKRDRFWDWKDPQLQPSPTRLLFKKTYFGSYVMDALYLALHITYHSNSFEEAVFKAVNWGGDSDSFGAIVGYLNGAMYGIDNTILKLYIDEMLVHDDYQTIVKAIKLYNKTPIKTDAYYRVSEGEPLI